MSFEAARLVLGKKQFLELQAVMCLHVGMQLQWEFPLADRQHWLFLKGKL